MIFLGFLLFLLCIAALVALFTFLAKTNALLHKVEWLEREVRRLSSATAHAEPDARSTAGPLQETPAPTTAISHPRSITHAHATADSPPPVSTPAPQGPEPAAGSAQLSRTREEWEALIGGKVLNRIGALALILGVGFFLKYAFDNNWITEMTRVLIGGVIGIALLLAGIRSDRKGLPIFAQGLIGAGVAILYLSVYASFIFYHLVPQGVAFALMSLVTIITFFQAITRNSLAVSLLGWLGGFLTPFLLSTGESNEAGLFTYIALLDLGLLGVVLWRERWIILEPLTAAATYFIYRLWHQQFYSPEHFGLTLVFLITFAVIFIGLHVAHIVRGTKQYLGVCNVVAGANALLYFGEIYLIVDPLYHNWMGLVTLAFGAIHLATSRALAVRKPDAASASTQLGVFAIIFLVFATAIQYSGFTTVILWSLEALLLSWVGERRHLQYVWITALSIFVLAGLKLLFTGGALRYSPAGSYMVLLNYRALAFLTLAATTGLAATLLKTIHVKAGHVICTSLHYTWCAFLFFLVTVETNDFFRQRLSYATSDVAASLEFNRLMVMALVWVVCSLPLVWVGLQRQVLPIIYVGLTQLALGACMALVRGISFEPMSLFNPLWNSRALILLAVILAGLAHGRWLKRRRALYDWAGDLSDVIRVSVVLLILGLLTAEARDFFQKAISLLEPATEPSSSQQEIGTLRAQLQLTLSGVWLVYSILVMGVGIWQRKRDLRVIAIVLFGVAILKIFIYDLSFLESLYRIFSFVGLGVILLATSYLYQRYKAVILSPDTKI